MKKLTNDEIRNRLNDALLNMTDSEKFDMLRDWQEDNGYDDNMWDYMDCFNDYCCGMDALDVIDAIDTDSFSTHDDYFKFTVYGVVTGNDYDVVQDFEDNLSDIIDWLLDYDTDRAYQLIIDDTSDSLDFDDDDELAYDD